MREIPSDLGRRIMEMARLAVEMHLKAVGEDLSDVGGADASGVTDDVPAAAKDLAVEFAGREAA